jgi:hypothetical protein
MDESQNEDHALLTKSEKPFAELQPQKMETNRPVAVKSIIVDPESQKHQNWVSLQFRET